MAKESAEKAEANKQGIGGNKERIIVKIIQDGGGGIICK